MRSIVTIPITSMNLLRNRFFLITIFSVTLTLGCSDNSTNAIDDLESELCANVSGIEALFWDIMNGVPRGDIPGGVPTISNPGGTYSHPGSSQLGFQLLGFQYPAGYTPQTDPTPNAIGVNVIRNDNQSIWRRSQLTIFNQVRARDVLTAEVNSLLNFFNGNGNNIERICTEERPIPVGQLAPGFTAEISNRLIRFDGITAVITTSVTNTPGGLTSIVIQKTASPTDQFESEIMNTYLPISWQLLFTGGGERDSDGDGVPDSRDQCPNTPPGTPVNANGCPAG